MLNENNRSSLRGGELHSNLDTMQCYVHSQSQKAYTETLKTVLHLSVNSASFIITFTRCSSFRHISTYFFFISSTRYNTPNTTQRSIHEISFCFPIRVSR
jgi:hypothetical protein